MSRKTIYLVDDETFTKCVQGSKSICEALQLMKLSFKGKAYITFRKRCEQLNIDTSHLANEKFIRANISEDTIKTACSESISRESTLRYLSLHPNSNSNRIWIDTHIKDWGICIDHWVGQGHLKGKTHNWTKGFDLSDVLIVNSTYSNTSALKRKLLKAELLNPYCYKCGIDSYQGEKIVLQLDHINGINNDNRIDNLRLLCALCHSLTSTYCRGHLKRNRSILAESPKEERIVTYISAAKVKKCLDCSKTVSHKAARCKSCAGRVAQVTKIVWPKNEELQKMVSETSFSATARLLGVSDNAIRKRLKLVVRVGVEPTEILSEDSF